MSSTERCLAGPFTVGWRRSGGWCSRSVSRRSSTGFPPSTFWISARCRFGRDGKPRPVSARAAGRGAYTGPRLWLARERRLPRALQVHPQKKSAPESAQSAEVERRKLLANGAGLTRRCGDRLARLDHGGVSRAGAVGDARGKANADDQRREDERHCHHLQVGKAAGGKQRKKEKKRAAGVVWVRRLVLVSRGLTGLLNPCVKSGTKLYQPYFMNCFNCASPAVLSDRVPANTVLQPAAPLLPSGAPAGRVRSSVPSGTSFRQNENPARVCLPGGPATGAGSREPSCYSARVK
jgi:hypothetical protein